MNNDKLFDTVNYIITLKEVNFSESQHSDNQVIEDIKSIVEDSYEYIDHSDSGVDIEFTRIITFDPDIVFNAKYKFLMYFKFNENYSKSELSKELIMDEIEKQADTLFSPALSHSSYLTSTFTLIGASLPLIQPPILSLVKK